MSDADPLDGADVGETRRVTETVELHSATYAPETFYGPDRAGEYGVDVTVSEDGYGDPVVEVTYTGEVTKQLPKRWDRGVDSGAGESGGRTRWPTVLGALATVGAAIGASALATHTLAAADLTINGSAVAPLRVWPTAVTVGLLALLAWTILHGVRGGFPGMHGGRR